MKNLSQILAELANHGNWEGYGLLHLAIEEAVKSQPLKSNMDALCKQLVELSGKSNPDTIYRSMARAVDDIWNKPSSRPLLREYYHQEVLEKPTPDNFISALALYLWEQAQLPSGQFSNAYQISLDSSCNKYGITFRTADMGYSISFGAFTKDLARIEQIVQILNERQISPETVKTAFLAGMFSDESS